MHPNIWFYQSASVIMVFSTCQKICELQHTFDRYRYTVIKIVQIGKRILRIIYDEGASEAITVLRGNVRVIPECPSLVWDVEAV